MSKFMSARPTQLLTIPSVLDGRVRSLRDNMSKQWSELLYNGLYFSPEAAFLQRKSIALPRLKASASQC